MNSSIVSLLKGKTVLVSSCLLGENCKYNGSNNLNKSIKSLADAGFFNAISFCPELAGGLTVPRLPSEIIGDRVINSAGVDLTVKFNAGAKEALNTCRIHNIKYGILKERSPSCGVRAIYDGTFSGRTINECGITSKLLRQNKIVLFSEEDFN